MSMTSTRLTEEVTLAKWARDIKPSELQEMLSAASQPGIISFALGLPAMELFPRAALSRAAATVLADDRRSLQYGPPSPRLKQQIVRLMGQRGVKCHEDQVFLTAGAQQGMNLLARLLLDPGGQVLVEEMIYPGFQQVIEPFQPQVLTVRTDPETGMDVPEVESILKRGTRPAFIYAISDGHNPVSVSLSLEKRKRLVELAREYQIPIVEDDAYGFLYYGDAAIPPLRAFEDQWVYYVGSFSKILAPGLRSGWLVVPEQLIPKLSIAKEASDIDTATFAQRTITAFLETEDLNSHLVRLRREYKTRRDTMLRSLNDYFPSGVQWRIPQTGVFVWVALPSEIDATILLKTAIERARVAFIPGRAFCVNLNCGLTNCLRLNFSNCSPDLIKEGMERLAQTMLEFQYVLRS
jgi:2-aminoadipate transaminase